MFKDEHRYGIWQQIRQHDLRAFARLLPQSSKKVRETAVLSLFDMFFQTSISNPEIHTNRRAGVMAPDRS